MPPKSKETSDYLPKTKKRCSLAIMEEISLKTEDVFSYEDECCAELELEDFKNELKLPLSKTALLIQDYIEFKAARCIQRFVRGWLYRTKYKRKRRASIKIQTEWRRFYCQRMYFRRFEQFLQESIEIHFFRSAQKIQALWRGWWVRHNVHDHTHLVNLQLLAGEDLLYCVAFKLHHLLRTQQIPGVYSLRNSSSYSKVEQLLASLKFKTCNRRSMQNIQQRRQECLEARKLHTNSAFGTEIPFPGPDVSIQCTDKCAPFYNSKDVDLRMSVILQMYDEANRETNKPKVLKKKSSRLLKQISASICKPSTFCGDVVKSIRKWKIIKENQVTVDNNVFKTPQNVENFLKEIESKMSLLEGNCFCRREFVDDIDKEKAKFQAENLSDNNLQKSQISCTKLQASIHKSSSTLNSKSF